MEDKEVMSTEIKLETPQVVLPTILHTPAKTINFSDLSWIGKVAHSFTHAGEIDEVGRFILKLITGIVISALAFVVIAMWAFSFFVYKRAPIQAMKYDEAVHYKQLTTDLKFVYEGTFYTIWTLDDERMAKTDYEYNKSRINALTVRVEELEKTLKELTKRYTSHLVIGHTIEKNEKKKGSNE